MTRSNWQAVFTVLLVAFSAHIAIHAFPARVWLLGASLCGVGFAALLLRVGWVVPLTITGVYVGLTMDAGIKSGTVESQMWETVISIGFGAMAGFVLGLLIDNWKRDRFATQQDAKS